MLGTLTSVAFGALLSLGIGFALEKRRELVKRRDELRNAYAKWISLQRGSIFELQEFFAIANDAAKQDRAALGRLSDRLDSVRPVFYSVSELTFAIAALEDDAKKRGLVERSSKLFRQAFATAAATSRALEKIEAQTAKIDELKRLLKQAPEGARELPDHMQGEEAVRSATTILEDQYRPTVTELRESASAATSGFLVVLDQLEKMAMPGKWGSEEFRP